MYHNVTICSVHAFATYVVDVAARCLFCFSSPPFSGGSGGPIRRLSGIAARRLSGRAVAGGAAGISSAVAVTPGIRRGQLRAMPQFGVQAGSGRQPVQTLEAVPEGHLLSPSVNFAPGALSFGAAAVGNSPGVMADCLKCVQDALGTKSEQRDEGGAGSQVFGDWASSQQSLAPTFGSQLMDDVLQCCDMALQHPGQ